MATNKLLYHLKQYNAEIRTELSGNFKRQNRLLKFINQNIRQIMQNSALSYSQVRHAHTDNNSEIHQVRNNYATLSNMPKTLHELWNDYEFGSGRSKPAKFFTTSERGKCRYTSPEKSCLGPNCR